ncbi:glycine--tRNA ligase subunit beta [Lactobacillus kefiranofaciens subsp. kefirgranum]|uniref:glycine--tRNA ligase subunit beta n=1 Tax=Lactobacillus kefiranofaciens TaxID=267818 RepID=UPI0006D0B475|nr:glycine--tRNA ligase subunit beta [Lactobacillus kefiranofaciens]KRL29273.1 glycyl-tRNA synthetase subunit beta [Lactobacillus kefiranofaciens subsp. kefirgranum DSM 10550 = JCM 8572]MCJ2171417.1 glycine--tRNA ligase subunit beta [Lactobacillus kefiranofaciens]MDF4141876.1 glycine--tRNA ligase subunit beta [Lactobacillus kefiranofaciens]QNT44947.1 glycine--tRNA ligase subunit beta [Lactobacillus kefiranofaciens]URW71899.1 glycine--tRNA ligase subunit beta [Lactobacillus kefiranofaciens subs
MAKDYLFEIGTEEMPAHVVPRSVKQLADRTRKFLKENGLKFKDIKTFSTPRRLTILVEDLAEKQDDIDEVKKGPAKKIAQDKDGNWTKAAQGFARGQGMTTDDIYFEELKGTEYAYVHVQKEGKKASDILLGMSDIVKAMTFPTKMRWDSNDFEFVRPIHWLVSLFGNDVIPVKILDITAGRKTEGHRFLGDSVVLANADDYEDALKDQYVIADAEERKDMIVNQMNELVKQNNWEIKPDRDLLEEVTYLVEYPTVFAGSFDKKYLNIPDEVLITSMKDNQRYFEVYDENGKLINHFIAVRNGNKDYLDNVISGNEKVLVARLDDAQFFYDEDRKYPLSHFVDRLKNVSFHDKIGSMAEKMQRVRMIGDYLAKRWNLPESVITDFDRASELYKFDLVTQMVGEFAELQGVMGMHYARLAGENEDVAVAIKEHYIPTTAEGELPTTTVGSLLSIADKIDTIVTFFGAGMIPTSSNDPYALRRYAYGIVRILLNEKWSLPFNEVLPEIIKMLNGVTPAKLPKGDADQEIADFIRDRVKQYLQKNKFKYDIIDAVLASSQQDPSQILAAANVLQLHHDDDEFKPVVESLTRIDNILKKAKFKGGIEVDESLFDDNSEKELYVGVQNLQDIEDLADLYQGFVQLQPVIDQYFDTNMIMAKDENVKNNRLAQLSVVSELADRLGDLSKLVIK